MVPAVWWVFGNFYHQIHSAVGILYETPFSNIQNPPLNLLTVPGLMRLGCGAIRLFCMGDADIPVRRSSRIDPGSAVRKTPGCGVTFSSQIGCRIG